MRCALNSRFLRAILGAVYGALSILLLSLGTAQAQGPDETPPLPIAPLLPAADPPAWAAFRYAWANVNAYSATATFFEQKGTQAQNSVFDYTFRKPASATVRRSIS